MVITLSGNVTNYLLDRKPQAKLNFLKKKLLSDNLYEFLCGIF